jgi:cardiolipin synthase (CMP-forming)
LSLNIPNVVTLGRVILVPVIFWLLVSGNTKAAFFAFLAAGISDAVDGFVAKRFKLETELGAYLDPLADKLLIVSIYVALGVAGNLPSWLVIAVVSRDILIVLGVLLAWIVGHAVTIRPLAVSKANTASQILLAAVVLADEGFKLGMTEVRWALVWTTLVLTVWSLAAYLREWMGLMAGSGLPPGTGGDPKA